LSARAERSVKASTLRIRSYAWTSDGRRRNLNESVKGIAFARARIPAGVAQAVGVSPAPHGLAAAAGV
jgi:hypothetical protein